MPTRWILAALMMAFVALCLMYISKTPYRQAGALRYQGGSAAPDIGAPDERQHANYVQILLDGKGFPVLKPGSPDLIETYQAHQPPLYYAIAAMWAKATGATPADPDTGVRLRYLNVLIGLGTLFGVFSFVKWGTDRTDAALAAVAISGLMPMFVALHSAVSNDPLLFFWCTWTVALCALGIRKGWDWKLGLTCGACAGLGLLTKTTSLALLPTVLAALIVSRKSSEVPLRTPIAAAALLVPLAIGLPWMARNQNLYGDPFAIKAFTAAFVGSPLPQHVAIPGRIEAGDPVYVSAAEDVLTQHPGQSARATIDMVYERAGLTGAAKFHYWSDWVGWWTARSFVGVFGYMDVFLLESSGPAASDAVYRLLIFVLGILAIVGGIAVKALDKAAKASALVGLCLFAVVVLLFVRFNLQYFQGQARYLYPAIGPIAACLGLGTCRLFERHKEWAWAIVAVLLGVVQLLAVSAINARF